MTSPALHTIGYEGRSIGDFLATLETAGINLLIDVRDVPISRKPGFSKTVLANVLATRNIGYLHLKGLGDPKLGRIAAREGRFKDFRRIFAAHLRSEIAQVDMIRGIEAASKQSACLLCFERDHRFCHRCMIAEEMAFRSGFELVHLGIQSPLTRNNHKRRKRSHDRALDLIG
jgi:uncharacterized protein (DUF488 family)